MSVVAQGIYPPAAGSTGTSAIHKDSSVFMDWASACSVQRGLQDIAKLNADTTSVGGPANVIGKADGISVVSLGDGGEAIVQFNGSIFDGQGPDFAIFENAFNPTFLELAFVEVSSDGVNFYRFPAHSLTDTSTAVGSFGEVEASNVNNLAGKYQANYGTPFDLNELKGISGLDIQKVTHIKIIDVVGSLQTGFATRDTAGNKINDQYPTAFPSGGFDLEAIGAIYMNPLGIDSRQQKAVKLYPNPASSQVTLDEKWRGASYEICNLQGKQVGSGKLTETSILVEPLTKGLYFLRVELYGEVRTAKLIKE